MSDPRLNGSHLDVDRRPRYDESVCELLGDRGEHTRRADSFFDELAAPHEAPPAGGSYVLIDQADGRRYPLRVGINAVGRSRENDLRLNTDYVSRRHCVILVHATGGCEVYDTASLNGTRVNGKQVTRSALLPGDLLDLCKQKLLMDWVGPGGDPPDSGIPEPWIVEGPRQTE
jgi:hypothetical protein